MYKQFRLLFTVTLAVFAITNMVNAQEQWIQEDFDAIFENGIHTIQFQPNQNGYEFRGDIQIPGDDVEQDQGGAEYTIEILPGTEIYFANGGGGAGGGLSPFVSTRTMP